MEMSNLGISYRREYGKNYCVMKNCDNDLISGFFGRMTLENNISGVLRGECMLVDGSIQIKYDITGRQPLNRLYQKAGLGYAHIRSLMEGLSRSVSAMEKHFLDPFQLILKPDCIYVDMDDRSPVFMPDYVNRHTRVEACELAGFLVDAVNHEDERALRMAYGFYEIIRNESFSLYELQRLLEPESFADDKHEENRAESYFDEPENFESEKCDGEKHNTEKSALEKQHIDTSKYLESLRLYDQTEDKSVYNPPLRSYRFFIGGVVAAVYGFLRAFIGCAGILGYVLSYPTGLYLGATGMGLMVLSVLLFYLHYRGKELPCKTEKAAEEKAAREIERLEKLNPETEEKLAAGKTVYIGESALSRIHELLFYQNGRESRVSIDSESFLLGTDEKSVHLKLYDNSVSRLHARIFEEDNDTYIEDLHSTNGTYVNDFLLSPHEKCRLRKGDIIQLGRMELCFN